MQYSLLDLAYSTAVSYILLKHFESEDVVLGVQDHSMKCVHYCEPVMTNSILLVCS